jgi:hypothetical protein
LTRRALSLEHQVDAGAQEHDGTTLHANDDALTAGGDDHERGRAIGPCIDDIRGERIVGDDESAFGHRLSTVNTARTIMTLIARKSLALHFIQST